MAKPHFFFVQENISHGWLSQNNNKDTLYVSEHFYNLPLGRLTYTSSCQNCWLFFQSLAWMEFQNMLLFPLLTDYFFLKKMASSYRIMLSTYLISSLCCVKWQNYGFNAFCFCYYTMGVYVLLLYTKNMIFN